MVTPRDCGYNEKGKRCPGQGLRWNDQSAPPVGVHPGGSCVKETGAGDLKGRFVPSSNRGKQLGNLDVGTSWEYVCEEG